MSSYIAGTCSLCRGPVVVPTGWMAASPPVPTCQRCGSTAASPYGPMLEMIPRAVASQRPPRPSSGD